MPFAGISRFVRRIRDDRAALLQIDPAVRKERNAFVSEQHFPNRRKVTARDRPVRSDHTMPRQMIGACAHGKADESCAARISDQLCNVTVADHLAAGNLLYNGIHLLKKRIRHVNETGPFRALPRNRKPARRSVAVRLLTDVRLQEACTGSRLRSPLRRRDPYHR